MAKVEPSRAGGCAEVGPDGRPECLDLESRWPRSRWRNSVFNSLAFRPIARQPSGGTWAGFPRVQRYAKRLTLHGLPADLILPDSIGEGRADF